LAKENRTPPGEGGMGRYFILRSGKENSKGRGAREVIGDLLGGAEATKKLEKRKTNGKNA